MVHDWIDKVRFRAAQLHWRRLSCAEAVWLSLQEDENNEKSMFGSKLASGFAGGLSSGSICGAVAAGAMAISSEFGNCPWEERSTRLKNLQTEYYQAVKDMLGSAYCRDLKPTDETQRQVCNRIIADTAGIAAKLIERERNIGL